MIVEREAPKFLSVFITIESPAELAAVRFVLGRGIDNMNPEHAFLKNAKQLFTELEKYS